MRHFAVIGLGNFGMSLATELSRLGQRVTAVDSDPDKAREAQAYVDQAMVADATEQGSLEAMGIADADVAAVSLGGRMDAATLVVLHLSRLGVHQIVAKALNEDHAEILSRVGATRVVFPEKEMAQRVAQRLSSQSVLDYLSLSADFSVIELAPNKALVGKSLMQLDLGRRYGVQVLAVKEIVPERVVIAPSAAQVIKDSDILVVMGSEAALSRLREA